jgi:hypothetical protein
MAVPPYVEITEWTLPPINRPVSAECRYLMHCYEKLCASSGSFFVFGHSADQSDAHIYDALFRSNITHLYFCIHKPTDDKIKRIGGDLARYKVRTGSKVDYSFVDSESAHVWDRPPGQSWDCETKPCRCSRRPSSARRR